MISYIECWLMREDVVSLEVAFGLLDSSLEIQLRVTLFFLLKGFSFGFFLGKVFKEAASFGSSISFEAAYGLLW